MYLVEYIYKLILNCAYYLMMTILVPIMTTILLEFLVYFNLSITKNLKDSYQIFNYRLKSGNLKMKYLLADDYD